MSFVIVALLPNKVSMIGDTRVTFKPEKDSGEQDYRAFHDHLCAKVTCVNRRLLIGHTGKTKNFAEIATFYRQMPDHEKRNLKTEDVLEYLLACDDLGDDSVIIAGKSKNHADYMLYALKEKRVDTILSNIKVPQPTELASAYFHYILTDHFTGSVEAINAEYYKGKSPLDGIIKVALAVSDNDVTVNNILYGWTITKGFNADPIEVNSEGVKILPVDILWSQLSAQHPGLK